MQVFSLGDTEVHLGERRARSPRGHFALTPRESSLLAYLVQRRGVTVDRERLLAEVWAYSPRVVSRAVDNTISRLRRKLEPDPTRPRWLVSTRGGATAWSCRATNCRRCPTSPHRSSAASETSPRCTRSSTRSRSSR